MRRRGQHPKLEHFLEVSRLHLSGTSLNVVNLRPSKSPLKLGQLRRSPPKIGETKVGSLKTRESFFPLTVLIMPSLRSVIPAVPMKYTR